MIWSVRSDQNISSFAHYGVKGMKWGVRKEYELKGRQSVSKKSFKSNSVSAGDYSRYDTPYIYTPKQKEEAIKRKKGVDKVIETNTGTTTIHINGTDDYNFFRDTMVKGKDSSRIEYAPESAALEKFRNLPRINGTATDGFERFSVNNNGPTYERRNNCFECAIAYEMRKRGYDVQANETLGGRSIETLHAFNVKDSFTVSSSSNEEAYKRVAGQCLAYGDGARGSINVQWDSGGGHAFNWEVKNGKFILIDTQQSDVSGDESFSNCDPSKIRVWRLDNAEVLPGVTDLVEPREQPKDAFYQKKWKKSASAFIKSGKESVNNVLKNIGRNVSEFVSKGTKIVGDFFKNPSNIQNKSSTSNPTIKKDSRTFVEKLLNIRKN